MEGTEVRVNPGVSPTVVRSRPPDPCVVVIFGVTGDLTHRKLVPALYNLAREGDLPERFALIGPSPSRRRAGRLRPEPGDAGGKYPRPTPPEGAGWTLFSAPLEPVPADVTPPADYRKLRAPGGGVEKKYTLIGNRLYY